ncbi:MAG: hypothetical protein P8179_21170 [Candidatus Thiodiazotropha sp.]
MTANKKSGQIRIGAIREIPAYMHWSFPLGGLVIALVLKKDESKDESRHPLNLRKRLEFA